MVLMIGSEVYIAFFFVRLRCIEAFVRVILSLTSILLWDSARHLFVSDKHNE